MTGVVDSVVLGASGYVGGELLRLIAAHPTFRLAAATSNSRAGTRVGDLIRPLAHAYPKNEFVALELALDEIEEGSALALFAAAPHGVSGAAVANVLATAAAKSLDIHVVDTSADFRYASATEFEAVYHTAHPAPELLGEFRCALPEQLSSVSTAHIGHPGCFATAVLLAAVPLFAADLAEPRIHVTGITGSTGSGRSPAAGTHHPDRHSNLYAYKPLAHRHAPEIAAIIRQATDQQVAVNFVPHSGPFARGIYVTLQTRLRAALTDADARKIFQEYYADSEFVHVLEGPPRLKDAVASNHCYLSASANGADLVVLCAIDNLVKGAAGGAMQWMNRLWSLPEGSGLDAPAPGWT